MTRPALGDFNDDGTQDTARITDFYDYSRIKYPMQTPSSHKELRING